VPAGPAAHLGPCLFHPDTPIMAHGKVDLPPSQCRGAMIETGRFARV
jgi:hypothetical protein